MGTRTDADPGRGRAARSILLTGGSGYVGGRLIPLLEQQPVRPPVPGPQPGEDAAPCAARAPRSSRATCSTRPSLDEALRGVHTAYYLVHLMSGSKDFEKEDRQAATNFAEAARKAGVRRIIYLGGLGDDADPNLSPHLRSRHEVGEILRDSGVETVEFRASMVDRGGQPVVRAGEVADRPAAGDALPPLAHDADPAHRRGRRAGLPPGGEGLASGREPHLRDRRHGCRDLRRPDPGVRPAEGAAAVADLGAGADARTCRACGWPW